MFNKERMQIALQSKRFIKPSGMTREQTRAYILSKSNDEHPDNVGFGEG